MGLYVSNLVHGVVNDVELELVYTFFISCPIAEISQVEANIGIFSKYLSRSNRI